MPDMSMSSNFHIEQQLGQIKPILRRNCLVNRSNIVIQWKSFEIYVVKLVYEDSSNTKSNKLHDRKLLNPVYVPFAELTYLLSLPLLQIEQRIVKSLKLGPTGTQFVYVPQDVLPENFAADDTFSRKNSGGTLLKKNSLHTSPRSSNNASDLQISPRMKNRRKQSYACAEKNSEEGRLEQLPEELITSLYIQQVNADF